MNYFENVLKLEKEKETIAKTLEKKLYKEYDVSYVNVGFHSDIPSITICIKDKMYCKIDRFNKKNISTLTNFKDLPIKDNDLFKILYKEIEDIADKIINKYL